MMLTTIQAVLKKGQRVRLNAGGRHFYEVAAIEAASSHDACRDLDW
jgi:hypothetical protein